MGIKLGHSYDKKKERKKNADYFLIDLIYLPDTNLIPRVKRLIRERSLRLLNVGISIICIASWDSLLIMTSLKEK